MGVIWERWRRGLAVGAALAAAAFAIAVTFGAFAVQAGLHPALAIAMSALAFSGSAQFAFVTSLSGGGGIGALGAPSLELTHRLGLDAVFPAFFAVLLVDVLRQRARPAPAHRRGHGGRVCEPVGGPDGVGQCLLASLVVVTIVGASGADAEAGVIGGVAVAVLLRLAGRHELLCVLAGLVVTAAVRALA